MRRLRSAFPRSRCEVSSIFSISSFTGHSHCLRCGLAARSQVALFGYERVRCHAVAHLATRYLSEGWRCIGWGDNKVLDKDPICAKLSLPSRLNWWLPSAEVGGVRLLPGCSQWCSFRHIEPQVPLVSSLADHRIGASGAFRLKEESLLPCRGGAEGLALKKL